MVKRIVITGATKGLGQALARKFAANGYTVAGCGTDAESVVAVARMLGRGHEMDVVDITDLGSVQAWASKLARSGGAIDYVINCAGVINDPAPTWALPAHVFEQVVDVNVVGPFNIAKAFVPILAQGDGAPGRDAILVNFSSGWGRNAKGGLSAYCASKFAVEGLSKALAQEVPASVKVFPLDPGGGINTDMLKTCLPDEYEEYPTADQWAGTAFDYLVNALPGEESGASLTVPSPV